MTMQCAECQRLRTERELRRLDYNLAVSRARAAYPAGSEEYMSLRARANEAKIDLDLAETELMQHQDRHAVPN